MVIFAECPSCNTKGRIKLNSDIALLKHKTKFEQNISCLACGVEYELTLKLKSKVKKAYDDPNYKMTAEEAHHALTGE